MARNRKKTTPENHERWLVSYADFITLLFAFFVVMFASSQADRGRAQQVSDSVREAIREGQVGKLVAEILGGADDQKGKGNAQMRGPGGAKVSRDEVAGKVAELTPSLEYLSRELEEDIRKRKINLTLEPRGLVVSLRESTFFPSGNDNIAPETFESLGKIASAIRGLPNPVRMEGHTDSIPIHNSRFRSNWELSAARAIAMLDLFGHEFGVPFDRMAVAGYADTAPVDSNDTPEGRARNRRVDIVILNLFGLKGEPAGKPSPARK